MLDLEWLTVINGLPAVIIVEKLPLTVRLRTLRHFLVSSAIPFFVLSLWDLVQHTWDSGSTSK